MQRHRPDPTKDIQGYGQTSSFTKNPIHPETLLSDRR